MTSANFRTISLDSIIIDRESRQRRELRNVEELAESIQNVGLINPPVVTQDLILVAGERRLEACRTLGWTSISVQFAEDLDQITLHLIELEENAKREDLTWQEHNRAISTYHSLRKQQEKDWSQARTAKELGVSDSKVRQHLLVAEELERAPEEFQDADKFNSALNIAQRKFDRRKEVAERKLTALPPGLRNTKPLEEGEAAPEPAPPQRKLEIENISFLDWGLTETDSFNLIHCDFPYGVNVGNKKGHGNAQSRGQYEDTPDVYFELINHLGQTLQNFCSPSAHMIFWFSMKFHDETRTLLESQGWRVDPFPLIWHKSDNAGIIPDANRGPRRTYETAFFCSRGDRKIVKPVANSFSGPTTKLFHTSEKPEAMLRHFFRMLVDDTTRLLDPTCGSGMAVKVAEAMGAEYSLGLEMNGEYAEAARTNCGL